MPRVEISSSKMWLLQVTASLQALKFDTGDYVCLKFILLLNAGQFSLLNGAVGGGRGAGGPPQDFSFQNHFIDILLILSGCIRTGTQTEATESLSFFS